jgi:peptide/nickel transport system permease protein
MLAYVVRRLLLAIPTLFLTMVLVFVLMRLIPGDAATMAVGDLQDAQAIAQVRESLGLDRSYVVQFGLWFGRVTRGDLGTAIMTGEPIGPTLLSRFAVTAQFAGLAVLIASLLAVPAGMLAAWRQDRTLDHAVVVSSVLLVSIPSFWLALMLILVFGIQLGWLPIVGYVSLTDDALSGIRYLILPVLALVLGEMGTIARLARASTLDVLRLEYITHARAKGLSERAVLWRHALPNSFAPTLTVIGLILGGNLMSAAAVTETVFSLPGLGRYLVDAMYARDYLVVQGCLLFVAVAFVVINVVIDVVYPLLDPRVRL